MFVYHQQRGFLLILICETSQIFVWRNKAFIFFQKSDIIYAWVAAVTGKMRVARLPKALKLIFSFLCTALDGDGRLQALGRKVSEERELYRTDARAEGMRCGSAAGHWITMTPAVAAGSLKG